jgi:hypothetical protein
MFDPESNYMYGFLAILAVSTLPVPDFIYNACQNKLV